MSNSQFDNNQFGGSFAHLGPQISAVLHASNEMDSTLLITGSTGTGKSHLAFAVHRASSKRANGRWFKINLATLSENLIESELFGHERGAFTGADCRRTGRLESCNGGTVFLDEIGELPLRLQAKLLDFIQYKRITPVGSNREIELDVRIIAATNRNLEAAVKAGEFRADLYHRLNIFHIRMPELSVNQRAIGQFSREFLTERAAQAGKPITGFAREVEQLFRHYPWPGNIRELENIVEFAVAMERSQVVGLSSLPTLLRDYAREQLKMQPDSAEAHGIAQVDDALAGEDPSPSQLEERIKPGTSVAGAIACLELPITIDFHESKEAFEKLYLLHALRLCGGQINLTSRKIGLNKVSLTEKIRKYAIDWRKIRYETFGPALHKAKSDEPPLAPAGAC